jgi:hypothetical protein
MELVKNCFDVSTDSSRGYPWFAANVVLELSWPTENSRARQGFTFTPQGVKYTTDEAKNF